ncbi:hypothetical protein HGG74_18860 [Arthrobacter sp. E918]|uniref:Uncharacterized protein n=1 Tax=Arthrobacter mobilis TaxID=2724944 RepID=A0A7X6K7F6_9MICC|nr:hypothetical protein [Arthrobacter mobilis]
MLQISLMLAWLLVEVPLDYIFKVDFRHTRWMIIGYVALFFTAPEACSVSPQPQAPLDRHGRILFRAMAVLAFVQLGLNGQ